MEYEKYTDSKNFDASCIFLLTSYLFVEETANTLLANLMTALSATDLSVMNEGYTALQQSQQERIKEWIGKIIHRIVNTKPKEVS